MGGHVRMTDDDIVQAVSFVSTYVVHNTNLELRGVFPAHDGILFAFIVAKSLLSYDDARLCLMLFRVEEDLVPRVISLLLWYGFLGVRDEDHEAQYIYNKGYNNKLYESYVSSRIEQGAALVINHAFWDGIRSEEHTTELQSIMRIS